MLTKIYTWSSFRVKIEPPSPLSSLSTSAFPSTSVFHSTSERFLLRQTSRRHVLDIEVKHQIPRFDARKNTEKKVFCFENEWIKLCNRYRPIYFYIFFNFPSWNSTMSIKKSGKIIQLLNNNNLLITKFLLISLIFKQIPNTDDSLEFKLFYTIFFRFLREVFIWGNRSMWMLLKIVYLASNIHSLAWNVHSPPTYTPMSSQQFSWWQSKQRGGNNIIVNIVLIFLDLFLWKESVFEFVLKVVDA